MYTSYKFKLFKFIFFGYDPINNDMPLTHHPFNIHMYIIKIWNEYCFNRVFFDKQVKSN